MNSWGMETVMESREKELANIGEKWCGDVDRIVRR
jgi:hypothetical protein